MTTPLPANPEDQLKRLGLTLPPPPNPVAAYIPVRRSGNLLFVAGQIPMRDGKPIATGLVPSQVPLPLARECAQQCTLNALAAIKGFLGGGSGGGEALARISQVIRVGCFVASEAGFTDHPQVANAASELLVSIFGDAGKHARAAVGAPSLPLGVPVEIEFLFEVR